MAIHAVCGTRVQDEGARGQDKAAAAGIFIMAAIAQMQAVCRCSKCCGPKGAARVTPLCLPYRLINPVVVAPTMTAVGLSFFAYGFPKVGMLPKAP